MPPVDEKVCEERSGNILSKVKDIDKKIDKIFNMLDGKPSLNSLPIPWILAMIAVAGMFISFFKD